MPPDRKRLGNYVLKEELGKGGMGVVYRARDERLKRTVAVKTILPGEDADPELVQRFKREAEAVARLRHPNIVTVHELGEADDTLFLAMDYVDGPTFAKRLREKGKDALSRRKAVEIVRDVARAIQHAHEQGVIHRDLKPQNVLLDASDKPYVVDFGLARVRGSRTQLTRSGSALGTPAYMPPEQASGELVDHRSDVYSLGATLYHALTGRPPFDGDGEIQVLAAVLSKRPAPPTRVDPEIPRDLEAICLRALEKRAQDRYASAAAFADDLGRWLKGERIATARPAVSAESSKRPLVLAIGFVALVGVVSLVALAKQVPERPAVPVQAPPPAKTDGADEEAARRASLELEKELAARKAADDVARAQPISYTKDTGFPKGFQPLLRSERTELALVTGVPKDAPGSPSEPISALVISEDGRLALAGQDDGVARVYDLESGALRATLGVPVKDEWTLAVALSANAKRALVVTVRGATLYDLEAGSGIAKPAIKETHWKIAQSAAAVFTLSGPRVLAGEEELRLVAAETGEAIWEKKPGPKRVTAVGISPDGKLAVSSGDDKLIWIRDLEKGQDLQEPVRSAPLTRIFFGPGSLFLATGQVGADAFIFDVASGARSDLKKPQKVVTGAAISPDGKLAATVGAEASNRVSLVLWEVATKAPVDKVTVDLDLSRIFLPSDGTTYYGPRPAVAFLPRGDGLVVGTDGGRLLRFALHPSRASQGDETALFLGSLDEDMTRLAAAETPTRRARFEDARAKLLDPDPRSRAKTGPDALKALVRDRALAAVPLLLEAIFKGAGTDEQRLTYDESRALLVLTGEKLETWNVYAEKVRESVRDLAGAYWKAAREQPRATDLAAMDASRLERVVLALMEEVPQGSFWADTRSAATTEAPGAIREELWRLDRERGKPHAWGDERLPGSAFKIVLVAGADRAYRYRAVGFLAEMKSHGWAAPLDSAARDAQGPAGAQLVALLALWESGEALRTADVLALLERQPPLDVRMNAILALGFSKDAAARPALEKLLLDKSSYVRGAAAQALGILAPGAAAASFEKLLFEASARDEIMTLMDALATDHSPAAADALGRYLEKCAADETVRDDLLFQVLAKFGDATGHFFTDVSDRRPLREKVKGALAWWQEERARRVPRK